MSRCLLLCMMLVCNGAVAQKVQAPRPASVSAPTQVPSSAPMHALAPASSGRFVVQPPLVKSDEWRAEARRMHAGGTLEEIASVLNDLVILPSDIGLRFSECEEPNAFYDGDARRIELCLELMQGMASTLEGQFDTEDAAAEALAGAFVAVVLHEVGHALVDVLEIPVTGREEDAVDQLSAWMLIESGDVESVLGAAASYYTDPDLAEEDFAGEHSLDRQRYFNMVCWVYGSDPDNQQELIESWELPEHRAEQCAAEYALLDRSWTRLLKGHLREGVAAVSRPVRLDISSPEPRTPSVPDFPITQRVPLDLSKPLGRAVSTWPAESDAPSSQDSGGRYRAVEKRR